LSIECRGVWKLYNDLMVIRDFSLKIDVGSCLAVVGPSGSGKTTLLRVLGLIDKPTRGDVFLDGEAVSSMVEKDLAELRWLKIGYSFQEPKLIPNLSVVENVLLPFFPRYKWFEIVNVKKKVIELLDMLGLEGLYKRKTRDLSTGQKKRVDLARALIKDSPILIADEPTVNLDRETARIVIEALKNNVEKGRTVIFSVTMDDELLKIANKMVKLEIGRHQIIK